MLSFKSGIHLLAIAALMGCGGGDSIEVNGTVVGYGGTVVDKKEYKCAQTMGGANADCYVCTNFSPLKRYVQKQSNCPYVLLGDKYYKIVRPAEKP